jgi:hypothetical protein
MAATSPAFPGWTARTRLVDGLTYDLSEALRNRSRSKRSSTDGVLDRLLRPPSE